MIFKIKCQIHVPPPYICRFLHYEGGTSLAYIHMARALFIIGHYLICAAKAMYGYCAAQILIINECYVFA